MASRDYDSVPLAETAEMRQRSMDHTYYTANGAEAIDGSSFTINNLGNQTQALPQHRLRGGAKRKPWYKRPIWIAGGILLVLIIVGASVGGAVGSHDSSKKSNTENAKTGAVLGDGSTWGGNGSTITASDGSTFTYNNSFGGIWVSTPYNFSATPRSDVPALSENWDFSYSRIEGVNLGGWLVLEPFITPALFEPYVAENGTSEVVDEYTLSKALGTNLSTVVTNHYDTFITEKDFAQIAGAGLTWVRLPFGFWAIETIDGEPYLEGVSWTYVLKALNWCIKYGLRMELDLHALPGSQNGQNHSGKLGTTGFLAGVMGIANAQRSLNYIRTLSEFIAQPEYAPVVQIFAVANEVNVYGIGLNTVRQFYLEAYNLIRDITGVGLGKGPYIAIHDGFMGQSTWAGFMSGADRMALETHYYLAYSPADYIIGDLRSQLNRPCVWWSPAMNTSLANFGFSMGGEWTLATNDCGQWINGMNTGSYYAGNYNSSNITTADGDCNAFTDWENFTDEYVLELRNLTQMYMDMGRNTFFWSWKMGANSTGKIPNPLWSYQLGLEQGWIPSDPRDSIGSCDAYAAEENISAASSASWSPPLSAWATGGSGAGTIAASATSNYTVWPPTSITNYPDVSNLYVYTATGTPITLTASPTSYSTFTPNGWFDANDTASYYTSVSGCSYPDPYSGVGVSTPSTQCASATAASASVAKRTAAPSRPLRVRQFPAATMKP